MRDAAAEQVVHLDDLLLRRSRLGLQLPQGAAALLPQVRTVCEPVLAWGDVKWDAEVARYQGIWRERYSVPGTQQATESGET